MNIRVETAAQYYVDPKPDPVHPPASPLADRGALARADDLGVVSAFRVAKQEGPKPLAVFVAHGMGQQLSFSTLDTTVEGLKQALLRRGYHEDAISATAQTVHLGDLRSPGVVLTVAPDPGQPALPPVHLFEGYWASLTEGQVTLRDVMRFLVQAAWNGLRKGVGQPIERYMFGHTSLHDVPSGTFLGLLVTALALGSLVLLNAVIAGVVVDASYDVLANGRATAAEAAAAASATLPRALTTLAAAYLAVTLLFGVLLGSAMLAARRTYARGGPGPVLRVAYGILFVVFFGWLLATLLAGLGTLAVLLHATQVALFDSAVLVAALVAAAGVALAAGVASWGHGRSLVAGYQAHVAECADEGRLSDFDERPLSGGRLMLVTWPIVGSVVVMLACVVALLAPAAPWLADLTPATKNPAFRVVTWFVLFGVSALIRNLLVQYFGDVAAYISPHTLDRFAELRRAIRDASVTVLRGVYHARSKGNEVLYAGVAVVGHSLGSVVAYDALNRVLAEDAAAENDKKDSGVRVRERTRLLLTFGSPLDKTAYIFRAQNQSLSKVREALANAVQPLILKTETRTFPWVNVHSTRDVIGSALDLYDLPDTKAAQRARAADLRGPASEGGFGREFDLAHRALDGAHCPFCVHDVADPGARVPLVAHNEHWKTWAVFDVLLAAITGPQAEVPAAVHSAATAAGGDGEGGAPAAPAG